MDVAAFYRKAGGPPILSSFFIHSSKINITL